MKSPTAGKLRLRGFNLTEKCVKRREVIPLHFRKAISRSLLSGDLISRVYSLLFVLDRSPRVVKVREADLKDIDDAVELGRKHGVT